MKEIPLHLENENQKIFGILNEGRKNYPLVILVTDLPVITLEHGIDFS